MIVLFLPRMRLKNLNDRPDVSDDELLSDSLPEALRGLQFVCQLSGKRPRMILLRPDPNSLSKLQHAVMGLRTGHCCYATALCLLHDCALSAEAETQESQ